MKGRHDSLLDGAEGITMTGERGGDGFQRIAKWASCACLGLARLVWWHVGAVATDELIGEF